MKWAGPTTVVWWLINGRDIMAAEVIPEEKKA